MKRRKSLFVFVALMLLASSMFSQASRKKEVTLVMVPRGDATVKVGMDLAGRYPTLLISYRVMPNGAVSLNGWTGTEWVTVTPEDFQAGNFFRKGPNTALVVAAEGASIPSSLIPPAEWAEAVYQISTTRTRPLLHLIGQYYDFKYEEWQWFAKRYALPLEAINPEGLNVAWYHKRLKENLSRSSVAEESDLRFWSIIRYPESPALVAEPVIAPADPVVEDEPVETTEPVEPEKKASEDPAEEALAEEASVEEAPAEQPDVAQPEAPEVNPLMSEVPTALVLGAGDADETQHPPVEGADDVQP